MSTTYNFVLLDEQYNIIYESCNILVLYAKQSRCKHETFLISKRAYENYINKSRSYSPSTRGVRAPIDLLPQPQST